MGAKPNLAICAYCGAIVSRTEDMGTSFVKCINCQMENKTDLLPLEQFLVKKNEWLRRIEHRK